MGFRALGFGLNYLGDGFRDRRQKRTFVDKIETRLHKSDSPTWPADACGARSPDPSPSVAELLHF